MFKSPDAADKKYKPLILKWLCEVFEYKNYPYSFRDQWIIWNVSHDGELWVSFDHRQEEQRKLFSMIPIRFLGAIQWKTLKIVNEKSFYLPLSRFLTIKYPEIISSKLLSKTKHIDNDGDDFYSYDWEIFLNDGTSIHYSNYSQHMDMKHGDYYYTNRINTREFLKFLEKYNN